MQQAALHTDCRKHHKIAPRCENIFSNTLFEIDNVSKVWANDEAIPPRTMVHVMVSKGILHGFQSVPTTWILTSHIKWDEMALQMSFAVHRGKGKKLLAGVWPSLAKPFSKFFSDLLRIAFTSIARSPRCPHNLWSTHPIHLNL